VFGLKLTLVAFVTYWIFSWATFRFYFSREVRMLAEILMKSEPGDDPDGSVSLEEALEDATRIVIGNMKTAGRGGGWF